MAGSKAGRKPLADKSLLRVCINTRVDPMTMKLLRNISKEIAGGKIGRGLDIIVQTHKNAGLTMSENKAWECPKCNVIHAPSVRRCNCQTQKTTNQKLIVNPKPEKKDK